ncbi:MAG: Crp/Fnr family transcriptional regulator [Bacteroidota bacterium]
MEPENLTVLLKNHPFLKGLADKHMQTLLSCVSNVRFQEGEYLSHEGQEAKNFYLIRSGRVALEIDAHERGTLRIQTIGENEVLGWSWLIAPYRWRFDSCALEQVRAFSLDGVCLRNKCDTNPEFGYEMLKRFSLIMAQRLDATRLQLLDMYGSRPGVR